MLSSKFRPRVIPMLYSFYLIVYLICISYFIIIFPFFMCCFFVCRLYIGFFFYHWFYVIFYLMFVFGDKDRDYIIIDMISLYVLSLGLCLFFGIYDNIKDISYDDFLFCLCCMWLLTLCDNGFIYYHWLMIIFFFIFMCLFWVMGI